MNIRHVRWAGVEFQPNLKDPQTPVRLGLVLQFSESGDSSVIVIGRMPIMKHRPKEFENTSPMTMEIAAKWVRIMGKETIDVTDDDLFTKLADGWHWNLYITEPTEIKVATSAKALTIAKRLYKHFVGKPFETAHKPTKHKPAKPRSRAAITTRRGTVSHEDIPPAWLLNEIMGRSLGEKRLS